MKSKINRSDYRKFAAWILTIAMTFSLSGFGVTYAQTGSGETATGSDALPAEEDGSFPDGTVGVDTEATDSDATVSDAFHAEETVDGIKIILDAPEGVFPKGAVLSAKKITEAGKLSDIREGISETKKEEGETAPETGNSVTLDISILDADGNEIEPDTSKGKVNVRFEEVSGTGLEVWHIPDAGKAEKMDTEVTKNKTDGKAAIAFEAETFSAYTIISFDSAIPAFGIIGGEEGIDYNSTEETVGGRKYFLLNILSSKPVTIVGGSKSNPVTFGRVRIEKNISANVTIKGLNMECSWDSPFKIADNSKGNVNITLAGENSLVSTNTENPSTAGLQKSGDGSSGTLTITGSGSLRAVGTRGTGIGGGYGGSGSNIKISGGSVTAIGNKGGAGIGGGDGGSGSNITISGGSVTAAGNIGGAGIGGGDGEAGSDITISGGSVNASFISGTPKEATTGGARPVYLATLMVQDSSGSAVSNQLLFSSLSNSDYSTLNYGTKDMHTDTDGKLYVYLPAGTDIAYLQDSSGTEYACTAAAGKIIVNNTGTQKEIYKQLTLSSISINKPSNKTNYIEGETFNPAGLVLDLNYEDGNTHTVSYNKARDKFTFSPSTLAAGNTSVTITYGGKSTTQAITVTKAKTDGNSSGGNYTPQWGQNGNNWTYRKPNGQYAQNEWQQLSFNGETSWYYFGSDKNMVSGWHQDNAGNWYYLKESSGTSGAGTGSGGGSYKGAMQTGWTADPQDEHRYYLDPSTGKMVTGWKEIDGRWYYFNETVPGQSGWSWSETEKKLVYADNGELPLGACIESMTANQKPE